MAPLRALRALLLAALASLMPLSGTALAEDLERPFGPAETLDYTCRYLGIPVGRGQIRVGTATPVNGQRVWPIVAFARTDPLFVMYPIKDKFVTWWDPRTGLTVGNDLLADEQGKRRRERLRFERERNKAFVTRDNETGGREEATAEIAPGSQDILAAIFALRARPLKVGDHEEIPIHTGRSQLTLRAEVERTETIEVPAGTFAVVAIKVQTGFTGHFEDKRALRIFMTDDPRHVPVRIDAEFAIGSLTVDLVGYQKGITDR
jgi:hypothetical protein